MEIHIDHGRTASSRPVNINVDAHFCVVSFAGRHRARRKVLLLVQEITKTRHPSPRENAEHVALVIVKLRWCFSAECQDLVGQERLHSRQTQVSEFGAAVEKDVNTLLIVSG